ncbi:MAG: hypothetical protein P1P72_09210, partial [ANME-2 cluster archaeon]|nr:hypothetical protein [ANME-2 cluster archaeon]
NIQMLDANENMSKQDKSLNEWVENEIHKHNITKEGFCDKRLIPTNTEFSHFPEFISERREILKNRLKELVR